MGWHGVLETKEFIMVKASGQVNNFKQAIVFLNGRESKKIADNTIVLRVCSKSVVIRLYNTDIITYFADNTHRIYTGGFCTQLTVQRLNQFGPEGWRYSRKMGDLISTYLGEIGKGGKK